MQAKAGGAKSKTPGQGSSNEGKYVSISMHAGKHHDLTFDKTDFTNKTYRGQPFQID